MTRTPVNDYDFSSLALVEMARLALVYSSGVNGYSHANKPALECQVREIPCRRGYAKGAIIPIATPKCRPRSPVATSHTAAVVLSALDGTPGG